MRMPFGQYKGLEIEKLPSSYLHWLSVNCDWNDKICEEADKEWQFREKFNNHTEDLLK